MKKMIGMAAIFCCTIYFAGAQSNSGFRKLRSDESAYLNNLYATLYASIPHEYKNWTAVGDPQKFSISEFWCHDAPDGVNCINDCPKSLGVGDPYSLSISQDFTMDGNESGALMAAAYKTIKDFSDAAQVAAALKSTNKSKVQIRIYNNIDGAEQVLSYCGKTPPQTIQLPVAAVLALKGIRSDACPIMSSGRVDMSGSYYDNAVIILGKPIASKKDEHTDDGLSDTRYIPGFDKSKISKPTTQNIVVTIKGDAADIDAVVAMIDWKKLSEMIGK